MTYILFSFVKGRLNKLGLTSHYLAGFIRKREVAVPVAMALIEQPASNYHNEKCITLLVFSESSFDFRFSSASRLHNILRNASLSEEQWLNNNMKMTTGCTKVESQKRSWNKI